MLWQCLEMLPVYKFRTVRQAQKHAKDEAVKGSIIPY
uniref:Uncharacterized protein n=1 Tax=Anguilla anguilla TaxID=7936 RepID=A0A0E9U7Z8_ANGAN